MTHTLTLTHTVHIMVLPKQGLSISFWQSVLNRWPTSPSAFIGPWKWLGVDVRVPFTSHWKKQLEGTSRPGLDERLRPEELHSSMVCRGACVIFQEGFKSSKLRKSSKPKSSKLFSRRFTEFEAHNGFSLSKRFLKVTSVPTLLRHLSG